MVEIRCTKLRTELEYLAYTNINVFRTKGEGTAFYMCL